MDTVPPGVLSEWRTDPFRLERMGATLVGLGVADMKGGLVAMLLAARALSDLVEEVGTLSLMLVADEENASAFGMAWLAEQGLLSGDAAVCGEPAGLGERAFQRLFVGQRGSCVAWLVAEGIPGHSAEDIPARARASAALAKGIDALLESDVFAGIVHPLDGTEPLVNVGTMVSGGVIPFAHPSSLRAAIEVRTIEGQQQNDVVDALQATLREAGLGERLRIEVEKPPLDWIPGGPMVTDEHLLSAASGAWRDTLARILCWRSSPEQLTAHIWPKPGSLVCPPWGRALSEWRIDQTSTSRLKIFREQ